MGLLDFFFPKRCVNCKRFGEYVCTDCFTYISFDVRQTCLVCNRQTFTGLTHDYCRGRYTIDGVFSSVVFNSIVKRLIYQFKYKPHLSDLTSFLVTLCYEGLIQNEAFHRIEKRGATLCPVPLHTSRGRERGYNQAGLLAKGLGKKFDLPILKLLIRTKKTAKQHELGRKERRKNLQDAFGLKRITADIPARVFLVDDVFTSGATLLEAASVLKRGGVTSVYGLTLAHGT